MDNCPQCKCKEIYICGGGNFLSYVSGIHYNGYIAMGFILSQPKQKRIKCECSLCDQKFWFYLKTGRITRRSK